LAINDEGTTTAVADDVRYFVWLGGRESSRCDEVPAFHPQAVAADQARSTFWVTHEGLRRQPNNRVGRIAAFDSQTRSLIDEWQNTESKRQLAVSAITSLDVGEYKLVAGSHDATVKLFDCIDRGRLKLTATARSDNGYITTVALSPDESLVAAGTTQGGIMTVRVADGEVTARLVPHGDSVTSLAFSGDGRLAASGGLDRQLILWGRSGDKLEQLLSLRLPTRVLQLEFTPDGRELLVLSHGESAVRVWQLDLLQRELGAIGLGW
jgi:WD40 repeat protein